MKTPIAMIYPEGVEISTLMDAPVHQTKDHTSNIQVAISPQPGRQLKGLRATPKARKMARSQGIDLSSLAGTGPRGMIVTADLDSISAAKPTATAKATPVARKMAEDCGIDLKNVTGTGPGGRITREDVSAAIAALAKGSQSGWQRLLRTHTPLPLDGLRGLIAERLSASWNERPQVTLHSEVDATELVAVRNRKLTPAGKKISLTPILSAAAARALAEFPSGQFATHRDRTGAIRSDQYWSRYRHRTRPGCAGAQGCRQIIIAGDRCWDQ